MRKATHQPKEPPAGRARDWLYGTVALAALIALGALWWFIQAPPPALTDTRPAVTQTPLPVVAPVPEKPVPARWVDEGTCQGCHGQQAKDWQGSHHQMAMQAADATTVLGDFNEVTFKGEVETARFFRQGAEYWVNTLGADGQPGNFKVAYTFGVAPLQQYLLEVPGGRLQALGVAWDTEQHRWFHLYAGQGVDFKNPLHWSQHLQNANFMCVECHTTGFKRNFDSTRNTFASQWNSLGVGCQACHGPASEHLAWTAKQSPVANAGFSLNLSAKSVVAEVETCARCHARRAPLRDGFSNDKRLMDDFLPALLTRELYTLDGKIKDEVFEVGSFEQSKMFSKGVRCSNCHNPHSNELKAPGNGVCLQCHNSAGKTPYDSVDGSGLQAKNYDSIEHTHHQPDQPGSQCVDCHMPGKFYMVNDLRHDHGFSLPNPARAQRLGTPDACLGCHQQTDASKVAEQFRLWYGSDKPQPQRYDEGLKQIRDGLPGASDALVTLLAQNNLPAIRRATLLAEVPGLPSAPALKQVRSALQSPEPRVRESAIHAATAMLDPAQVVPALIPLLKDPIKAVRIAAARDLVQPAGSGLGADQPAFDAAIREYEEVQKSVAERAEANFNLAILYQAQGRTDQVEPALRTALLRDPDFEPAVVALAQWLDSHQRGREADTLIDTALDSHPQAAMLHHAKGLRLIRARQMSAGIAALSAAVKQNPEDARYRFVLAVALHDSGQPQQANTVLRDGLQLQPANRQLRLTLAQYYREQGDDQAAQELILDLHQINPQDPLFTPPAR